MPSTSRGYPYPTSTSAADVPADILALAASLNTDVTSVVLQESNDVVLTLMGAV